MDDPIYEKLTEATSIRGFITASVALFDEAVDSLINRVFRKTDFAVKSVVDSLFMTSGPLFDLSIRLKVLLGLGVIEHKIFEDINAFIKFKETLNNDEKEHRFFDPLIIEFVQHLHLQQDKNLLNFPDDKEDPNSLSYQIKTQRKEKLVRSCLMLTINAIYEHLQVESPL
ncbi:MULTISPECIES: MltR family transcriptional regulator [unclassified Avibacterium]|uniref:MltR family transcriptional regulator n=1 Tax=unclassified Avibacterium TaxID=2685287 RepID=UPI002026623C|nr:MULTISPECIES: MltR family transcriptional regulator [unclassified Avibacterium]URL01793.1 MltR family transcriptional regulator [Avibacterium sp. 20-126]MCW9698865.1 MltR family transcriptional regulator [Avibacterium sp. 20-129]MCW9719005.1 MltR family transcriptional regulator [Avibacterium sp. 21-599]MCW9733223.1 MltR family transcriptional regulator [Avibacterium sp. 20-15]URL05340.1 MltR family transcriptional regulator [Avibacterium sp. 20-132]